MMTTAARLDDAREALHLLLTGQKEVEVEVDGRRVRYSHTDVDKLQGYVARLEDELAGRRRLTGAIGITFG
jgi:hypothetical protein